MRVRKFLFIDLQIANPQNANPQSCWWASPQIANPQIFTIRQRELNIFLKKFPPFIAKLFKSQLQVCLAEFLFDKNLN